MRFKAKIEAEGISKEIYDVLKNGFGEEGISFDGKTISSEFKEQSISVLRGKINTFLRNMKMLQDAEVFLNEHEQR
jgi:tRNA threonylcarbamoyladenosine modification (KEOPS) complex  Pcc1 subunit